MRTRHTFRLPPTLSSKLADYAARKRVSQAAVVEAAVASHLSPDGADRLEAALARRLDRIARQIERLERHVKISNEAVALFVRFWLTNIPPLPDAAQPAAQANGRERYEDYVAALGRRIARGTTLADEITVEMNASDTVLRPAPPVKTLAQGAPTDAPPEATIQRNAEYRRGRTS